MEGRARRRRLSARVLCRAAEIVGGKRALRKYLHVSALSLSVWMAGAEAAPPDVFLKAVDLIVEQEIENIRHRG